MSTDSIASRTRASKKQTAVDTSMMVIPQGCKDYAENNIADYQKVVSRDSSFKFLTFEEFLKLDEEQTINYLMYLSDREIFDFLGVIVAYRSRQELVVSSALALKEDTFFLLVENTLEETRTICYGTVTNHACYDCEEITEDFLTQFTMEEMIALHYLLTTFIS